MQLTDKQKYEINILHERNYSIRQIAKDMNINKNTVERWLKRYKNTNSIERQDGSGRKEKLTTDQKKTIVNEIQKNDLITANRIKENVEADGISISVSTVRNILRSSKFSYGAPKLKPLLTEKHKLRRLQWAEQHVNTNWDVIIFSDETSIWKDSRRTKRWMKKNNEGDSGVERIIQHPIKVHIWGCITNDILLFHIFNETMNAPIYLEILDNNLLQIYTDEYVFQDDNDPKHRSKLVSDWKHTKNIKCLDWPSCSPDLNPIENIWSEVKNKIARTRTKTMNEFVECIKNEFENINMDHVRNAIKSMPNRIRKVIELKGDSIDY